MAVTCSCECHTNLYAACSTPGGCGTTGCGRDRQGACPCCRLRDPEQGAVCEPCRNWLPVALASIPRLAADARNELIPADDSTTQRVLVCSTCRRTTPWTANCGGARHPGQPRLDNPEHKDWHGVWFEAHLITHTGGPAPSVAPDAIITGGANEAPTPLDLHLHDLLADVVRDGGRPVDTTRDTMVPADTLVPVTVPAAWFEVTERREETRNPDGTTTVTIHRDHRHVRREIELKQRRILTDPHGNPLLRPAGDQTGVISIAQILDQEARAMIDAGAPGSRWRPTPTVDTLTEWIGRRLYWAYDNHPGIDALTAAIRHIRGQLMAVLGQFDPPPAPCDGVECNRCDRRQLYHATDGSADVICGNDNCRKVYRHDEYTQWVEHLATYERGKRTAREIWDLLHAREPATTP